MANYRNMEIDSSLIGMIRHMQTVNDCTEELNNLQAVWDSLTLLGQLSGTGTDMNNTRQSFQKLTGSLLNELSSETLHKTLGEMRSKAQVTIDILVRNLFERTADIGFLATDHDICELLKAANQQNGVYSRRINLADKFNALHQRFAEYAAKYTVYSDIVLFDVDGEILLRLNSDVNVKKSHHPLIAQALNTTTNYVETFDQIDFLPGDKPSLVYSYRVIDDNQDPQGVLSLCFRFDNEMESIFANLIAEQDWSVISLLDSRGRVIASSDNIQVPLGAQLKPVLAQAYSIQRFAGREYLALSRRSIGYQGYSGPEWLAHIMLPIEQAFNWQAIGLNNYVSPKELENIMQHSQLFSESLRKIPIQAQHIQRELNRSVWNGNVRQCRSDQHKETGFSKILLSEISNTGERTQSVFQRSIDNLHETVVSAVLEDSHFQASLAINIMDRNLYERANDCRWWALTSSFRQILAAGELDTAGKNHISRILSYINSLYTVYESLFVFDTKGTLVATSNQTLNAYLGENVGEEWYRRALQLNDSQGYVVSDFVQTRFYHNDYTYIYGAAIRDPQGEKVVGGIGVVFDARPQFSTMLRDTLPKDIHGKIDPTSFGVFVSERGKVIACSDQRFNVGDDLPLIAHIDATHNNHKNIAVVNMQNNIVALGAQTCSGYREYKGAEDSYHNRVIAVIAKNLCAVAETREDVIEVPCPDIRRERNQAGASLEVATFRIGKEWFCMRAQHIVEAIDTDNITHAPGAGTLCVGYIIYDKAPTPIFDIRTIICAEHNRTAPATRELQKLIIVEKNADSRLGIIADGLGEIPEVSLSRINELPKFVAGSVLLADAAIAPNDPNNKQLLLVLSNERLTEKLISSLAEKTIPFTKNTKETRVDECKSL